MLFELVADGNPDRDVALAAIKLFHQARGATTDEVEIPTHQNASRGRDRGRRDGGKERKGGPKGQSAATSAPAPG